MSMPIQRQSEQFSIFDDGPRYARDRQSTDLPRGLAALVNTSGPRIQAGLLNTRQAGWHTPDYDPRVDGYPGEDLDRPSAADFAQEDWENERQRNYPRGQGPAWNHDEAYPDPDLENLEEVGDPDRFLPGDHVARRGSGRHPFDRAAARRQADKDGECTCWEGYERVPGTKPCASGSCRRKSSSRLAGGGIDWSQVRTGPLVDVPIRRQDPEDYFNWIEDDTPNCPTCGYHPRHVPGPGCRHSSRQDHLVPWEEDGVGGWHHPVGGFRVSPAEDEPGHYQLWSPHVGRSGDLAKIFFPQRDPQALIDWANRTMGGPKTNTRVSFAPAPPVPGASAYQPAHRVGLPWRDQVIPGTVIGLDGPHVAIRWDDGQYSSEEPHNIHLL